MTVEDKYVIVVFNEEGSKESYRVTINSQDHLENIISQYTFTLKQYLDKGGNSKPLLQTKSMPLSADNSNQPRFSGNVGN